MRKDKKLFKIVHRYMNKYGFERTFNTYDDWKEIEDPEFHALKKDFIDSVQRLEKYVRVKSGELEEADCEQIYGNN